MKVIEPLLPCSRVLRQCLRRAAVSNFGLVAWLQEKLHLSRLSRWARIRFVKSNFQSVRARVLPNPSLKRSANGRPPGPGLWHTVHFHSPGPGVLPLSPA